MLLCNFLSDNISRCRGFGYVQFVLQDDADTAVKTEKKINERILKISYADKKPKQKRKRGKSRFLFSNL